MNNAKSHMNKERPVYISLTQFRWPVTAIASIVHRVTGAGLFLGIAYLLWLLDLALQSEEGFAEAGAVLTAPFAKLVLWGVLVMLLYHILAGVKHLIMDFHIGDSFEAASRSAYVVYLLTAVLAAATGAWIW
jgi:succinate dehydrogenase / fumarate reductase cytochrome b subunit